MKKLWNWLNGTGLGRAIQSYVKVFASVILGLFLADGANVFSVDASDLKLWLAAGLSSVLPLVLTALNPRDGRFGVKPNLVTSAPANGPLTKLVKDEEKMNPLPKTPAAKKKVTD